MSRSNLRIIRNIQSGIWHLQPSVAVSLMPIVTRFLNGELESSWADIEAEASDDKISPQAQRYLNSYSSESKPYVSERDTWYYEHFPVLDGNVLYMPIIGAIAQEDYCGTPGTLTLQSWYKQAEADEEVLSVVEIRSSGGGEVFGTRGLAEAKLKFSKPIVGFVRDIDCSASAYIGAADDYTFVGSVDAMLGSIGTMMTFRDWSKYYEKYGLVEKDLYPETSSKKNDDYRRALNGDYKGYTEGILADFDKNFISFMKEYRPNISKEALQGSHYLTEEGIKHGLADEIGTLEDAYNKALSLSTNYSISNKSNIMSKVTMQVPSHFTGVVKALGGSVVTDDPAAEAAPAADTAPEKDDEAPVAKATTENASGDSPAATPTTEEANPLQARVTELETQLSTANTEKAAMETALVQLGKDNPAAARTAARQVGADPQPANPAATEEIEFTPSASFGAVPEAEK